MNCSWRLEMMPMMTMVTIVSPFTVFMFPFHTYPLRQKQNSDKSRCIRNRRLLNPMAQLPITGTWGSVMPRHYVTDDATYSSTQYVTSTHAVRFFFVVFPDIQPDHRSLALIPVGELSIACDVLFCEAVGVLFWMIMIWLTYAWFIYSDHARSLLYSAISWCLQMQ